MSVEIDPQLLQEVMAECRKDLPDLPDYFIWLNSVDIIMRNMGVDKSDEANELYNNAKKELETSTYNFQVV